MNSSRIRSFTPGSAKASLLQSAGLKSWRLTNLFRSIGKRAGSEKKLLGSGLVLAANAPALTLDHGLAAAGVAAAIGSAVFAGYMMTHENNPPIFGGVEHLRLFAQPLSPGWRRTSFGDGRGGGRPVDYNATGSIRRGGSAAAGDVESKGEGFVESTDGKIQAARRGMVIEGYVVRFVHKGLAIVQGPKGSYAVAPGVTLPNAGRVLSIQKRGNRWVVVTAQGLIREPVF
jgi:hypothetical protein